MNTLSTILLLLGFCVLLALGLLNVLHDLMQKSHDEPVFGDDAESNSKTGSEPEGSAARR